jgi:hypothetical protein
MATVPSIKMVMTGEWFANGIVLPTSKTQIHKKHRDING